jgi:aspartate aminotransferase
MGFLDVGGKDWEELAQNRNLVHMGHNCNQLPIHSSIRQVMISAIEAEEFRNYSPPYGFKELRDLIRNDIGIQGMEVLITQGSTDAIYQAMSTYLKPGDETIISDPGWPHIGNFARSLGSTVIDVPVYGREASYKLNPDLVRKHVTPRTKMIAIIDPLNPLGSVYTEDEIRDLCRIAAKSKAYVLHDCTYRDFAWGRHYPAIRYYDRAIMAVSLSKSCAFAGLRLGAVVTKPDLFNQMAEKHISRLGVNWVTQRGAIAAYKSKAEWLPGLLETNKSHQAMIHECLQSIKGWQPIVFPSYGNFLAIDVTGTGASADVIVKKVLDKGIVIRSGGYTSRRFGEQFIRITTTVPLEHVEQLCNILPALM